MDMSESHFYQALKRITGNAPPEWLKQVTTAHYLSNLDDARSAELQDWVIDNTNLPWVSGMAVIEAAIVLVGESLLESGNSESSKLDSYCLGSDDGKHQYCGFGQPAVVRCDCCCEVKP